MEKTALTSISTFLGNALTLAQVLRAGSGWMPMSARSVMNRSARSISTSCPPSFSLLMRQGLDDAVGVRDFDRVGLRRAGVGPEADVVADDQQAVGGAVEADQPLVAEVERVAAEIHHARPAGDGDGQDQFLVVLVLADLHEELLLFLVVVQRKQPFEPLGPLDHLVPVGQLLRFFRNPDQQFGGLLLGLGLRLGLGFRFLGPAGAQPRPGSEQIAQAGGHTPHDARSARSHDAPLGEDRFCEPHRGRKTRAAHGAVILPRRERK